MTKDPDDKMLSDFEDQLEPAFDVEKLKYKNVDAGISKSDREQGYTVVPMPTDKQAPDVPTKNPTWDEAK